MNIDKTTILPHRKLVRVGDEDDIPVRTRLRCKEINQACDDFFKRKNLTGPTIREVQASHYKQRKEKK